MEDENINIQEESSDGDEKVLSFSDLDKKGKAGYIWDYYKLPIISAVLIIIVAVTFLCRPPEKQLYCGIGIYGPHVSIDNMELMTDELETKAAVPDTHKVDIENFFLTESEEYEDRLQDVDMVNKFNTYLAAQQLHLVISNEDRYSEFLQADVIDSLDKHLDENLIKQLEDKDLIYYGKGKNDEEDKPYGIDITNTAILKNSNVLQENGNIYIGITPVEGSEENVLKILNAILK